MWYPAIDSPQVEARFWLKESLNIHGEPLNTVIVHTRVKGMSDVSSQKCSPELIKRFPKSYEAYTKGIELPLEGTPIDELPGLPKEVASYWKINGIRTCEDLANCSDGTIKGLGLNALGLQKTAKIIVENSAKDKKLAEMDDIKRQLAELKAAKAEEAPAPIKTPQKTKQKSA